MTYTLESLAQINGRFLGTHLHLLDVDVSHANHLSELIESTRNPDRPMPGDIVEFTTRYGDFYPNAHIESIEKGELYICEQPYTPFVDAVNREIYYSTSGGAWSHIPNNLKWIGRRPKRFTDWGHCGPCADGAVDFFAEVNVWEYAQPDPLFGSYTTKDYRKQYISYDPEDSSPFGYHYYGEGHAYRTEEEYLAWLTTYHGVEFEGFRENQTVVFCYRKNELLVSEEEWDALKLPTDTRMMNGTIIEIKYQTDHTSHIVTEYRYTNAASGKESWTLSCPYAAAMCKIKRGEVSRNILPKTDR